MVKKVKGKKLWKTVPLSGSELLHDKDFPKDIKKKYDEDNLNEKLTNFADNFVKKDSKKLMKKVYKLNDDVI